MGIVVEGSRGCRFLYSPLDIREERASREDVLPCLLLTAHTFLSGPITMEVQSSHCLLPFPDAVGGSNERRFSPFSRPMETWGMVFPGSVKRECGGVQRI